MPTLTASEIVDLVTGTLKNMKRMKFQQIAQDLTNYEVMGKWLKKERTILDDGYGIQRTLMAKTGGVASHVGLYGADNIDVSDHLTQLDVPWRHATTAWAFERRELLMNRGASLVTKIIEPRRAGAMIDLASELETRAWSSPPSTTDELKPYGIAYYVPYVASSAGGFSGANPGSHTTTAGVNITTYPNYQNWTQTYVAFTKNDLIKKMRKAARKTNFVSPVTINDYRKGSGQRFRIYVDETTMSALEDVGESQNENLGRDIASVNGADITFRKNPIVYVPLLDDNASSETTNPIYMIDHNSWFVYMLKGDVMHEEAPAKAPNSHNTYQVFVDLTYNYVCVDRRRNAVLSK